MKQQAKPTQRWIVVADSQKARLLAGSLNPHGRPHLEERGEIATDYLPSERERSSARHSEIHHGHQDSTHEPEERVRHFARQLAGWLEGRFQEHGVTGCLLVAPPRFLGALRKELPAALSARLVERHGEVMKLDAGALARHPAIAEDLRAALG